MHDYGRIGRIIRYLDSHYNEQPNLEEIAKVADLSPYHFHRLFSSWAGITPKDFIQCLTLRHARQVLQRGESVLDAAIDAGLSGPGRLHDLCVSLDAATPGEIKSGGKGLTIHYGVGTSPFGPCLLANTDRGICHLAFFDTPEPNIARIETDWPQAHLKRNDREAKAELLRIFTPTNPVKPTHLRAFVRATAFQQRVWRALLEIPYGNLTTYGRLASQVGKEGAARAIGTAVGANPIAYLIPCHRVIRETGVIGNYRWHPIRKRLLIAWESAEVQRLE